VEWPRKRKSTSSPVFGSGSFAPLWAHLFPGGNSFADNPIYRLGEGGGGLVDWNIQQTNGVGWQSIASAWHRDIIPLPPNAAEAQTDNLVATKAGEEPCDGKCSGHLYRVAS
jgi:hypothetical protein